jgi:hypothetical protein
MPVVLLDCLMLLDSAGTVSIPPLWPCAVVALWKLHLCSKCVRPEHNNKIRQRRIIIDLKNAGYPSITTNKGHNKNAIEKNID